MKFINKNLNVIHMDLAFEFETNNVVIKFSKFILYY